MRTGEKQWYLFDVNPSTPPTFEVAQGEEFTLEVRGAFADVKDIRTVPTPFTPACDGHPLAPVAGPVLIRGAQPGDVAVVDLLEITPHGEGKTAILRDFGVRGEPMTETLHYRHVSRAVREGRAGRDALVARGAHPYLVFMADLRLRMEREAVTFEYF